jgi:RNA polymerase sigma factor (sigma-70 family)
MCPFFSLDRSGAIGLDGSEGRTPVEARLQSDEVLVERLLPAANRDPEDRAAAWGEWYTNVGAASVLAFVRVTNDTSEPDTDIVQEAMVTAYVEVERGRYEPRAGISFAAYVKGIARNKIREARRRMRRLSRLEDIPEYLTESDEPCPETLVERHERQVFLRRRLLELSPVRKQIFQGRDAPEIAETLGMSEESVRQHKSRGVRGLRRALQAERSYG